jgi:hypothetical protein
MDHADGEGWRSHETLRRVGMLLGYGLLGVVSTAAVALVVLNVMNPLQAVVYDVFYLRLGPSGATKAAILAHFMLGSVVGLGVTMLAAEYLDTRGENFRAVGAGFAGLLVLVFGFLVVALAGLAAFLTALIVLAVAFVGIPIALRFPFGVRSGALPAFVGGIPVVVLLLFLAGFGLGWGWGYVVTAEEVPSSSVEGATANFDEIPEVRDDLFAGDCETTSADQHRCTLQLRGYEHERTAASFLARHGGRCPYQNTPSSEADAFTAEHDGTYYRVTCSPHGD